MKTIINSTCICMLLALGNYSNTIFAATSSLLSSADPSCANQDDDKENSSTDSAEEGATVRGQFVFPSDNRKDIDLNDLKIKLTEQAKLDPIPFPENWAEMKVEQRQKWVENFEASDEGKKIIDKRKAQFDSRKIFEIEVKDDGKFVLFDVPEQVYSLTGRVDQEVDGKLFAFEVFGQVTVGKVNEVQLAPLPVAVTRLVRLEESAPKISGKDLGGSNVDLESLRGNYVLVSFWNSEFEPSANEMKAMVKIAAGLNSVSSDLKMFSVCLNSDKSAAQKFVTDNRIGWPQVFAGDWQHESAIDYGVRSLPSYWLIGKDGKVLVTNPMFFQLFRSGSTNLQQIVLDAMSGKDVMAELNKAAATADKNESDK